MPPQLSIAAAGLAGVRTMLDWAAAEGLGIKRSGPPRGEPDRKSSGD